MPVVGYGLLALILILTRSFIPTANCIEYYFLGTAQRGTSGHNRFHCTMFAPLILTLFLYQRLDNIFNSSP